MAASSTLRVDTLQAFESVLCAEILEDCIVFVCRFLIALDSVAVPSNTTRAIAAATSNEDGIATEVTALTDGGCSTVPSSAYSEDGLVPLNAFKSLEYQIADDLG